MYLQQEKRKPANASTKNNRNFGRLKTPWAPSFFTPCLNTSGYCAFINQLGCLSTKSTDLIPKTIGRFQVGTELGRGGMGIVSRGIDDNREQVAIKTIHSQLNKSASLIGRFKEEGNLLSRIDSPFVPRFLEAGCVNDIHYYAMEFFGSLNMWQFINGNQDSSLDDRLKICVETTRALADVHRCRVVHGDIKPGNILIDIPAKTENLSGSGAYGRLEPKNAIKIGDFGLSWFADAREHKFRPRTSGTPGYMAPEQLDHSNSTSQRADVYSLGATAFHLLSGQPLFSDASDLEELKSMHQNRQPPRLTDIVPMLGDQISRAIENSLQKNPTDRYPNAGAMLNDLESVN